VSAIDATSSLTAVCEAEVLSDMQGSSPGHGSENTNRLDDGDVREIQSSGGSWVYVMHMLQIRLCRHGRCVSGKHMLDGCSTRSSSIECIGTRTILLPCATTPCVTQIPGLRTTLGGGTTTQPKRWIGYRQF